ncbi:hypothetical protein ACVWVX_001157 [Ewingella americana]
MQAGGVTNQQRGDDEQAEAGDQHNLLAELIHQDPGGDLHAGISEEVEAGDQPHFGVGLRANGGLNFREDRRQDGAVDPDNRPAEAEHDDDFLPVQRVNAAAGG